MNSSNTMNSEDSKKYYAILQVSRNCTQEQIQEAFEKQYTKYHPELDPSNEARFKLITEAYFVLYNPESRALYDKGLKLSEEEDWDKSRAFFEDQLRVWYHMNPLVGRSNNAAYREFQKGLTTGWGRQITTVKLQEIPPETTRVLAMRHGLGFHNESLGIMSVANRDAQLVPDVGVAQAKDTGILLREVGLFSPPLSDSLLIVISPFRRTLQTAINVMGSNSWTIPTIVTPLASEHSYEISVVKQGDRGSKTSVLRKWFPASEHPQFEDFKDVDQYCVDMNCEDGKWWHHGPRWAETPASFSARAERFRRFLVAAARERTCNTVLVISHGGLLTEAFNRTKYDNCEVRCFDVSDNGSFKLSFPDDLNEEKCDNSQGKRRASSTSAERLFRVPSSRTITPTVSESNTPPDPSPSNGRRENAPSFSSLSARAWSSLGGVAAVAASQSINAMSSIAATVASTATAATVYALSGAGGSAGNNQQGERDVVEPTDDYYSISYSDVGVCNQEPSIDVDHKSAEVDLISFIDDDENR